MAFAVSANLLILFLLLGIGVALPRATPAPRLKTFEVQVPEPPEPPKPPPRQRDGQVAAPARETFRAPEPTIEIADLPVIIQAAPPAPPMALAAPGPAVEGGVAKGPPVAAADPPAEPTVYFAKDWERKPTSRQLDRYRPAGSPAGWAVISCRTAPKRRVTDCMEVESFPPNSRLAAAVRQAAWQFRIMPPRRNGQDLIGVPIQIRVDYVSPKR